MASSYPLVHLITRISALAPVFSPWETCAMKIIEKNRPSSVSFICQSGQHCPDHNVLKALQMPSQTILRLEPQEWPFFNRHDMVFLVYDRVVTWNKEAVARYRRRGQNNFKLVIVANMSDAFEDDLSSMRDLFSVIWLSGIVRSAVVVVNGTSSQIYTYLPFRNNSVCEDTTPVLLGECTKTFREVFNLTYKVFNLNQCPVRIAHIDESPFIRLPLQGRLSHLIKEIAHKMNASLEPMTPASGNGGGLCGPGEQTGTRGMVYNGTAHMGIGNFNQRECGTLEYIGMAYMQCIAWCTPVLSARDYVYLFVIKQLQFEVWVALIVSVIVVTVSVLVLSPVALENWTSNDAFNLALTIYAQPPPVEPFTTPIRMIVFIWLWACLVLRSAYEGEMKGQSAARLDSHIIHGEEELSNTDLLLCSTVANLQMLDTVNNPITRKISRKSKICNGSLFENIAIAASHKDRAVLLSDLHCSATASELQQDNALYSRTGGCFKTYQMAPVIMLSGSPFKLRFRSMLSRCIQAGLVPKWLDIRPPRRYTRGAHALSLGHLFPALFVLGVGCLLGLLLFVAENMCRKWPQFSLSLSAGFSR